VPISGQPISDAVSIDDAALNATSVTFELDSSTSGTAHAFLWAGNHDPVPVFLSSCADPGDGFNVCSSSDGGIPPWGTDMGGRIVADLVIDVTPGSHDISIPIDGAGHDALAAMGSLIIGFESDGGRVAAFDIPLAQATVTVEVDPNPSILGNPVTFSATVSGTDPFPGTPTGTVTFFVDGSPVSGAIALNASGMASYASEPLDKGDHEVTAEYSGDGDYAPSSGSATAMVHYPFGGFGPPVSNPPATNANKAGSAVPLKFSLEGYRGADVVVGASFQPTSCSTGDPVGDPVDVEIIGNVTYSPGNDTYQLVLKTDGSWSGACGELLLHLDDDSSRPILVEFR
jgi:hypothetical protein